jgi:DNA-binding beta-propeller fold protein YncE
MYLAAPDPTGADQAHNVLAFDPVAAQITATVPVTSRPGALAISDDDAYLYVAPAYVEGRLERLRLPNLLVDLSVPLIDSRGGSCDASDVAVAPSRPTLVALGCQLHVGGPSPTAVVVFDGATLRGNADGALPSSGIDADPHYVVWGTDSSRVFASNVRSPTLYDIAVGAADVHTTRVAAAPAGGPIRFAGGLLYSDSGSIFDAGTLARVASLVPQREGTDGVPLRVMVVPAQSRVFAIARFPNLPSIHFREPLSLVSFDLAQRTQIASMPLDPTLIYGDLLRVGGDGLALLAESRLILVNGPFVGP